METRDLNAVLCDLGLQRWKGGRYRLTPEYEGRGLAQDRLFIYYAKDGKQRERSYLVWTQRGADYVRRVIGAKRYAGVSPAAGASETPAYQPCKAVMSHPP